MKLHHTVSLLLLLQLGRNYDISSTTCPLLCQCFSSTTVICSDLLMKALPVNVPEHVTTLLIVASGLTSLQELEISGSFVLALEAGTFNKLDKLTKLLLSNNKLMIVAPGIFDSLEKLETLQMSGNLLQSLHKALFHKLSNLQSLNLSSNKLSTINTRKLSKLKMLDLGLNQITNLSLDTFEENPQLQFLSLQGNQITELTPGIFSHLDNLEELNLRNNKIMGLSSELFPSNLKKISLRGNALVDLSSSTLNGLFNLTHLDLSQNLISSLPAELFQNLTSLEYLNLSENMLQELASTAFRGLFQISVIDLQKNNLSLLEADLFVNQGKMSRLNLARNHLKYLPVGILEPLDFECLLQLRGNPWCCDCDLVYFHNWLSYASSLVVDLSQIYCSDPPHLSGMSLIAVNKEQLVCMNRLISQEQQTLKQATGSDSDRQCSLQETDGDIVVQCKLMKCTDLKLDMEEGYELDLTYVTERIIAVSFPQVCSEETYLHNLKDVTRMLKSKHADNYLVINLSEKKHDLTKMNPKICTICKAMENWLNNDPLHVVVIHCRGGKGRIGVIISSFVYFTDISASADQALDRFAMRKFYDDKVAALMTPSQKRYVWILNSLLSGSMKMNASPLFLHCIILHGIPNFDNSGVIYVEHATPPGHVTQVCYVLQGRNRLSVAWPRHSDHALSASSDSGLSSASLWTERCPASGGKSTGPSEQEKADLNRLLSGFGLDETRADDGMELTSASQGVLHHPGRVHINGNSRQKERETDILDDEVLMSGHDLRSVDSLGTLSSSYHKSSQNSLLSDGFCSPGVIEDVPHHGPVAMEEYERVYAETRRNCLAKSTVSAPITTTSSTASRGQQFRQGNYSTQTWVRQQQMVAAPHYSYLHEEGGMDENFHRDKQEISSRVVNDDPKHSAMNPKVSPNKECDKNNDEEFNSLTVDIDNSIDQLNRLILDLDPTFEPIPTRNNSVKRNGGSTTITTTCNNNNGLTLRLSENNRNQQTVVPPTGESVCALSRQNSDVAERSPRAPVYRANSVEYRGPSPDTGTDTVPPTPAFPISPPTPYVKTMPEFMHFPQTPSASTPTFGAFRMEHDVKAFTDVLGPEASKVKLSDRVFTHTPATRGVISLIDSTGQSSYPEGALLSSINTQLSGPMTYNQNLHHPHLHPHPAPGPNAHSSPLGIQRTRIVQYAQNHSPARSFDEEPDGLSFEPQQPPLPEKMRDCERSIGSVSPAPSGFSSPHSGSSLSIPFPNSLPELQARSNSISPLPDVLVSKQVTVKFVQDTTKYWYKPDIAREQAISVLKDKEPGSFIVRDSHSFKGSLTALVCQHSITPLALPCKLIIPDRDPLEDAVEAAPQSISNSAAELLKQGAACNVWFLGSVELESLTGYHAVQKATTDLLGCESALCSTVVHFKVSSQGITLTDNQRKLFFRRHYAVNTVIFCALDPQDRKIFGFIARKTGSGMDNICHLFAEHDPEQPASAIVNFVSKVMIGSQKNA
ncbi:Tensin-3 [Bagarius yarrelli]|uniref:Tensin-3 n=1 Tax=Bagarius yarrelli TaxID=175774 RepID=A0A556VB91_BAGYA|nr:Tensin-3 [Bagarius yarrelli]